MPARPIIMSSFAAFLLGLSLCLPDGQAEATTAQRPLARSGPQLVIENPDGPPGPQRLVFSRLGSPDTPPGVGMHDRASLHLRNTGTAPLHVTGLTLQGPWTSTAVTLPATIPAGGSLDLPLTFSAAPALDSPATVVSGTLTIRSDDPAGRSRTVQLVGVWQGYSERTPAGVPDEPSLEQLLSAFGYPVRLYSDADKASPTVGSPIPINQHGWVHAQGEEVLAARWQRANATQPVQVEELAAYETQGAATRLAWAAPDGGDLHTVLTHQPGDSQSVLPRLQGGSAPASGSFNPPGAFLLQVTNNIGTEWSDPARNAQQDDHDNGCPGPCGQHLRFWPLRGQDSALVPNTYLLVVDYVTANGPNDDYQDDVFLIHNVTPARP